MTETNNPIINTYLTSTVRLLPIHMDNNFRKYIKSSLEKEHENKCFKDYGYVIKIHECNIDTDAYISAEDPLCCPIFKVKFLCSLCRPLNNTTIIGRIEGIAPPIIKVVNGPINVIIKSTNVNKNIFMFNTKINSWIAKISNKSDDINNKEENKFMSLKDGVYVKVKIMNKKIVDKSNKILCMGFLESLASEDEIKQSIKNNYVVHEFSDIRQMVEEDNKNNK